MSAVVKLSVIVPLGPDEVEWNGLVPQLGVAMPESSEVILVAARPPVPKPPADWPEHLALRRFDGGAGRGRQLNHGARQADGEWLWFLHADSRLGPETMAALQVFLARGEAALGWFDLAFRPGGPPLMRLNAYGANLRSAWLGIPFGDQGFVIPARSFAALGGFEENAPYGEDHLLAWAARRAGIPLRRIGACLFTSARKYERGGWAATTARHLWLTAVAIFVKTPSLSPVKTRLAQGIGSTLATEFHRRAAAAVGAVAHAAAPDLAPHWAVAEQGALVHPAWSAFPTLWQGDNDLGTRLDRVYAALLERHRSVLLIGADAPQVTPALLRDAARTVRNGGPPYVIGPATDGGFWLFGGRAPVSSDGLRSVAYSRADTGARLAEALRRFGSISWVPALADTDEASDLPKLASALRCLRDPLPEQASLGDWLRTVRPVPAFPELAQETS